MRARLALVLIIALLGPIAAGQPHAEFSVGGDRVVIERGDELVAIIGTE